MGQSGWSRKGVGVRARRFAAWAWLISCFQRECDQFCGDGALFSQAEQKLIALAPGLLLAVLAVSRNGTAWSGAASRRRCFVGCCGVERCGAEGKPASQRSPSGKGRDFHGAQHGLASGAGSDGRVIGATLARAVKVMAHGRRAPCPLVLEARAVCAVSAGGSMGCCRARDSAP